MYDEFQYRRTDVRFVLLASWSFTNYSHRSRTTTKTSPAVPVLLEHHEKPRKTVSSNTTTKNKAPVVDQDPQSLLNPTRQEEILARRV